MGSRPAFPPQLLHSGGCPVYCYSYRSGLYKRYFNAAQRDWGWYLLPHCTADCLVRYTKNIVVMPARHPHSTQDSVPRKSVGTFLFASWPTQVFLVCWRVWDSFLLSGSNLTWTHGLMFLLKRSQLEERGCRNLSFEHCLKDVLAGSHGTLADHQPLAVAP